MKRVSLINSRKRNNLIFYSLLAIYPVAQFLVFYVGVNFNSILLAFKSYDTLTATSTFVGLDNFKQVWYDLFHLADLEYAMGNSLLNYFIYGILGQVLILLFSFYIYKKRFASNLYKILLFLPTILSSVVITILYKYFCDNVLTQIVSWFTGEMVPAYLGDPDTQRGFIIGFVVWMTFGTSLLMYVSNMSAIPESLPESAQLDGCTVMQEFLHITLPQIYPTIITFMITNMAGVFTAQMSLMEFYAANAETNLIVYGYYLYIQTAKATQSGYPYLSAMGLIFTAIIVPITLGLKWAMNKFGPKED